MLNVLTTGTKGLPKLALCSQMDAKPKLTQQE